MKEFLKPTRKKIIWTIVFVAIWFGWQFLKNLFGLELTSLALPCPTFAANPPMHFMNVDTTVLSEWKDAANRCGPTSYLQIIFLFIQQAGSVIIIIGVLYVISCILAYLFGEKKKTKSKQKKF